MFLFSFFCFFSCQRLVARFLVFSLDCLEEEERNEGRRRVDLKLIPHSYLDT